MNSPLPNHERVSIESLRLDPQNARLHPLKNMEAIKASLEEFGQQRDILVARSTGTVVAGNGTLMAAKELGWTDINVTWTDLEGDRAMAYALADNGTSLLADWDIPILEIQISQLNLAGIKIQTFGFQDFKLSDADYSVLDGESDPDFDGMRSGMRKAIQIDFEIGDYDEAFALVKRMRSDGVYVGGILLEVLRENG